MLGTSPAKKERKAVHPTAIGCPHIYAASAHRHAPAVPAAPAARAPAATPPHQPCRRCSCCCPCPCCCCACCPCCDCCQGSSSISPSGSPCAQRAVVRLPPSSYDSATPGMLSPLFNASLPAGGACLGVVWVGGFCGWGVGGGSVCVRKCGWCGCGLVGGGGGPQQALLPWRRGCVVHGGCLAQTHMWGGMWL